MIITHVKFDFVILINYFLLFPGSSLANYTPKGGASIEEFQLGVTRSVASPAPAAVKAQIEELQEVEQPIVFSAGTNSDILF